MVFIKKRPYWEGMSRGGLIVYNWAAQNSLIKWLASMPMHRSWTSRRVGRWEKVLMQVRPRMWHGCWKPTALRIKKTGFALEKNPLNHAAKIAQADIPVLLRSRRCRRYCSGVREYSPFRKSPEMKRLGAVMWFTNRVSAIIRIHWTIPNPLYVSYWLLAGGPTIVPMPFRKRVSLGCRMGGRLRVAFSGWISKPRWTNVNWNCCCWAIPLRKVGAACVSSSSKPGKQAMDDALGQSWESAGISGWRT